MNINLYFALIGLAAITMSGLTYLIAKDALKFEAKKRTLKALFYKFLASVILGIILLFIAFGTGVIDYFVLGLGSLMIYIGSLWWFFRKVLWHAASAMSGNKAAYALIGISVSTYAGLKIYVKTHDINPLPFLAYTICGLVAAIVLLLLVELVSNRILRKAFEKAGSEEEIDTLIENLNEADLKDAQRMVRKDKI